MVVGSNHGHAVRRCADLGVDRSLAVAVDQALVGLDDLELDGKLIVLDQDPGDGSACWPQLIENAAAAGLDLDGVLIVIGQKANDGSARWPALDEEHASGSADQIH